MSDTPRLTLVGTEAFERDVRLRMPFRFGVVTLTEAPQLFLRARIRLENGAEGWGTAAEMLAPKWFDKSPELTNEENFAQLRRATSIAAALYGGRSRPLAAFDLHAACQGEQLEACGSRALNPLVAGFGSALLDRAILDALCRLRDVSIFEATRTNLMGLGAATANDLEGFDIEAFLAGLRPAAAIHARHTVGLVDAITASDLADENRLDDGLPQTLEECVRHYGLRYFKLKVGGDHAADLDRLEAIAAVLDKEAGDYRATLDGNEQYESAEAVTALMAGMAERPGLARLKEAILFVEQPIKRQAAFSTAIHPLAERAPVEIDESDATIASFLEAKSLGYTGVSSKSCKGFYRSLLNRARCAKWNEEEGGSRYFMSAEDLTTQAGLAVQEDLALATLIGCEHVERNGHHYVNGMTGIPEKEQEAFLKAHPDLYHREDGVVRLKISSGLIQLGSLDVPGLAAAAEPDFGSMRVLDLES